MDEGSDKTSILGDGELESNVDGPGPVVRVIARKPYRYGRYRGVQTSRRHEKHTIVSCKFSVWPITAYNRQWKESQYDWSSGFVSIGSECGDDGKESGDGVWRYRTQLCSNSNVT